MPIQVTCACGQQYEVPESAQGEQVECPECGQTIAIPAATPAAAAASPAEPGTCPGCSQPVPDGAVLCTNCGHDFRTGSTLVGKDTPADGAGADRSRCLRLAIKIGVPLLILLGLFLADYRWGFQRLSRVRREYARATEEVLSRVEQFVEDVMPRELQYAGIDAAKHSLLTAVPDPLQFSGDLVAPNGMPCRVYVVYRRADDKVAAHFIAGAEEWTMCSRWDGNGFVEVAEERTVGALKRVSWPAIDSVVPSAKTLRSPKARPAAKRGPVTLEEFAQITVGVRDGMDGFAIKDRLGEPQAIEDAHDREFQGAKKWLYLGANGTRFEFTMYANCAVKKAVEPRSAAGR